MTTTSNSEARDALRRSIGRLKHEDLVSICEGELGAPPQGKAWRGRSKPELVDALMRGLPEPRVGKLAAEGEARMRAPGFRGFIWEAPGLQHRDSDGGAALLTLTAADFGSEVMDPLIAEVPAGDSSSMFFELSFTTEELKVDYDGVPRRFQNHRTANIAIDFISGVLTVFASRADLAALIAPAVATKLGTELRVLKLSQIDVPSIDGAASFSPSALQVFEIVFGRFAETYDILYAPAIWVRPLAAKAVARERASKSDGADILTDEIVIKELSEGAEVRGIRFFLRERLGEKTDRTPLMLPTTLHVDEHLGTSMSIAGGTNRPDLIMPIYENLRMLMMRAAPSDGGSLQAKITQLQASIAELKGGV